MIPRLPKHLPTCLLYRITTRNSHQLRSIASSIFISDTPHPPTAPKPTPNLRAIRESADYHAQNCVNRNYPALTQVPSRIISLHAEIAALQKSARKDRERSNELTAHLKSLAQNGEPPPEEILTEAKTLKQKLTTIEVTESNLDAEMRALALSLPNRTHSSTPIGTEPRILEYINGQIEGTDWSRRTKCHTDIGAELGLLDFATAGTVSGWGWYYLLDDLVLLEQALVNYALMKAREVGWKLVTPPSIVYSHIASAAGFQPRDQNGEQQVYTLESSGRIPHSLAGTAEIPLAGLGANRIFKSGELPLKVVGVGRAYRAEAGARGVESKGLYRVHEFTKVELFAWCPQDIPVKQDGGTSEVAENVFTEMLEFQKDFVKSLGLYARVLEMPTTDLGASASRKVDIEVYMPSRESKDPWGEVSSLSNCTDYQARRLSTKVKENNGGREFAWTLNGTAVAVPRMLIALLEYGYEKGVGVRVPEVLRPFMGGIEVITKR